MTRTQHDRAELLALLMGGQVIPAHPLALTPQRELDAESQAALSRYYLAAGAGGLAVGVHTTQFGLRDHGLLGPVLELAAGALHEFEARDGRRRIAVAGVCGDTRAAVAEAAMARERGYDLVLPALPALRDAPDDAVVEHLRALGEVLPVFAFYLQPAVGGRPLARALWRRILELPEVLAVKVAPFDRYRTLDVTAALAESGRAAEVALYTGNDDAFLWDLLTEHVHPGPAGEVRLRFAGGLLGQWAVGTRCAVEVLDRVRALRQSGAPVPQELLVLAAQWTELNAWLFDAAHGFAGCLPGLHRVLARQGLMQGEWCLDPRAGLSPGQGRGIDRLLEAYPALWDRDFVAAHRQEWRQRS